MRTRQRHFNPITLDLNPKTTICKTCGGKYTKDNFSDECPTCTFIDDCLFPKDINSITTKQVKLNEI